VKLRAAGRLDREIGQPEVHMAIPTAFSFDRSASRPDRRAHLARTRFSPACVAEMAVFMAGAQMSSRLATPAEIPMDRIGHPDGSRGADLLQVVAAAVVQVVA
jgi:hypothetical protein